MNSRIPKRFLLRLALGALGAAGVISHGPGLAATFGIDPFTAFSFHTWCRDPGGACGNSYHTSSAVRVSFLP